MKSVTLSFLLDNMNRYRDIDNIEQVYKVRAIDNMMAEIRMDRNLPWVLKKGTLRVFDGVYEYAVKTDHDELAYIDKQDIENYRDTLRLYNTSLQQFYEQSKNTRNLLTDIHKDTERLIGLNVNSLDLSSIKLSSAETASEYTASDDASGIELDNVVFRKGSGSIKFTVTASANVATIQNTTSLGSDSNYKTKYQFRWVYLAAVPTSIELRFQTDDSNYLATVVTTQFDGTAFKAGDWNLVGHDLNEATETGTFNSSSIASEKTIINGASTGVYRVDESNLRQWKLLDYWYYSIFNVVSNGSTAPDKERFIDKDESEGDIDIEDSIVGVAKWISYVLHGAMSDLLNEVENDELSEKVLAKFNKAQSAFDAKYPTMTPLITTSRHRFQNDPIVSNLQHDRYRN